MARRGRLSGEEKRAGLVRTEVQSECWGLQEARQNKLKPFQPPDKNTSVKEISKR